MKPIDQETENKIRQLYVIEGRGAEETAAILGHSYDWLVRRLRILGIYIRNGRDVRLQHRCNESYFDKIDTHEKATVLGFIYADGCILDKGRGKEAKRLSIALQMRDVEYLEFIKKAISYTGPITSFVRSYDKRQYCRMVVSSDRLCEGLIKAGCYPRKSLVCEFPNSEQVSEEFLPSFLAGFFDGDGGYGMTIRKNGTIPDALIAFAISYDMGILLKQILGETLAILSNFSRKHNTNIEEGPRGGIWRLSVSGNKQVLKLTEWMSQHCPFRLSRKWNQYLELRKHYDDNLEFIETDEWKKNKSNKVIAFRTGKKHSPESIERMSQSAKIVSRRLFKSLSLISPGGAIYHSNCMTRMVNEILSPLGFHNPYASYLMRDKVVSYKGWTKATPEQVEVARQAGTLIEKLY
jgi:hypothetical protein